MEAWTARAFAMLSELPGVHRVGIAIIEGGGRRLRFTASDRDGDGDVAWCDVDAYDDVPLNTAVRSGKPVVGSLDDLRERYPAYADRQRTTPTVALAAVPVATAGKTLGGFLLLFDGPQRFDREQTRELARLARELARALRGVRAREHRRASDRSMAGSAVAGARVATHEVADDPAAVAGARRFLKGVVADWQLGDDVEYAATLCVSELVTNALIHSHGGCLVRAVLHEGVLTTSVLDWGSSPRAAVGRVDDPLQVHGRGLQLVEALADRWGHELDEDGASVWFALDVG
jgi:anti-sigma regulatory factor (Ser/Thr protein kinase)